MINTNKQSYKDLEIFNLSKQLAVKIHKITINELPNFEMYEEGSQIRRSSKSIVTNIVEGYGRRLYKNDFLKFLIYAIASCDETRTHLDLLFETGSLKIENFEAIKCDYDVLGAKIYRFRESVIEKHKT